MKVFEDKLIIEKDGQLLHYSSDGISREMIAVPLDLVESCREAIINLQQNSQFLTTLTTSKVAAIEDIFRRYGYKLYQAVIPRELQDNLYRYKSIHIYEKNLSDPLDYHWELMHDGHKFCHSFIPIIRDYLPKVVGYYDAAPKKALQLSVSQFNCAFGKFRANNRTLYPKANVFITPPSLEMFYNSQIKFTNLGFLRRKKLIQTLKGDTPCIIIISAYCNQQGLFSYNKQENALEVISFYTLGNILKNAQLKGLQGIIFRFWDWESNKPLDYLPQWLSDASVPFALSLSGLVREDVLRTYLKLFLTGLAAGLSLEKSHLKVLARLSNTYNSVFLTPYFRFYTLKDSRSSFNLKITAAKKDSLLNVVPGHIKKKEECVRFGLEQTSFVLDIKNHFSNGLTKPLILATTDFQVLEDVLFSWIANLSFDFNTDFEVLNLPFDALGIISLTEMVTDAEGSAFIDKFWENFVVFNVTAPSVTKNFLIVPDKMLANDSFTRWLQQREKEGFTLIQICYVNSTEKMPAAVVCNRLDVVETLRDYELSGKIQTELQSLNSPLLGNRLWLKIWPNYHQPEWRAALSLSKDDFYRQSIDKLIAKLSPEELKAVALLYCVKSFVPVGMFLKWLDFESINDNLTNLIRLDVIFISLDKKILWLNPSYIALFNRYGFLSAKEFRHYTKGFTLKFNESSAADSLSARQLFLIANNLAEFLAFQNDYHSAVRVLLGVREQLILKADFSTDQLLLLGMAVLHWCEHLEAETLPNWAGRIWRSFFLPVLDLVPVDIAINISKKALEKFSQLEQWGGYSLVTAYLAGLYYRPSENRVFLNLAKEALQIAAEVSDLHYFDVNIIILKLLAAKDDLALFEDFAAKFNYDSDLVAAYPERKKDLALIDLWHALRVAPQDEVFAAHDRFKGYPAKLPSRFELTVVKSFLEFSQKNQQHKKYANSIWERISKLAQLLKDKNTVNQVSNHFYKHYMVLEDWSGALKYALLLLVEAKDDYDLDGVRLWSDRVAMIYFKMGETEFNTDYYAIAQDPQKIYQ